MLHTTLVLSIVPSFWLLNKDFPLNNPSALSVYPILTECRHAAVSCKGSTHTGSKQSCVNCVKNVDRINLGHINLIDELVHFDSPNYNIGFFLSVVGHIC